MEERKKKSVRILRKKSIQFSPTRPKSKKASKRSNNTKFNIAPWIAGELKIRSLTKDEKELFEVISIQKEDQNLVRQFGTQKGANRFYNKIYRLKTKERERGLLVSCYTSKRTQKLKVQRGCRVCGRHPLMGEDFCSDHI
jgi:hypothetical protein